MNRKIKFAILGVVILIVALIVAGVYLQLHLPQKEIRPPPAFLEINGNNQTSGIGSYCWLEGGIGGWTGLCADYAGIPTVGEPLKTNSTFTAHLSLPLKTPPEELQINIINVTDKDIEMDAGELRFWRSSVGKYITLPLENEQDIALSLEPGLYVLEVFPRWKEKGSVSYGFLLKVQ